jgi:hypothetical protein
MPSNAVVEHVYMASTPRVENANLVRVRLEHLGAAADIIWNDAYGGLQYPTESAPMTSPFAGLPAEGVWLTLPTTAYIGYGYVVVFMIGIKWRVPAPPPTPTPVFAITTDGPAWQYNGTPGNWTRIGENSAAMAAYGSEVYGIEEGVGAVWRYNGSPGNWTRVGQDPGAAAITVSSRGIFVIRGSDRASLQYDAAQGRWVQIGAKTLDMVAYGNEVYGIEEGVGAVWRYNGTPGSWTRVGQDPGAAAITVSSRGIFVIRASDRAILQYNGATGGWDVIGAQGEAVVVP